MIPLTKQAAALRYLAMAVDPRKKAKASEAFKAAYKVDLDEACTEAIQTIETMREPE